MMEKEEGRTVVINESMNHFQEQNQGLIPGPTIWMVSSGNIFFSGITE